jgi:hypothetical protein
MRLNFRKVGDGYKAPYPRWLRDLKGKSGVYVIRKEGGFGDGEILYIGESHTDRLYKTITRHFQSWGRTVNLYHPWGRFKGHEYDRGSVSVAVVPTSKRRAVELQYELIRKHNPRDNDVDGDGIAEDDGGFFDY